jgi:hypothetical protein
MGVRNRHREVIERLAIAFFPDVSDRSLRVDDTASRER